METLEALVSFSERDEVTGGDRLITNHILEFAYLLQEVFVIIGLQFFHGERVQREVAVRDVFADRGQPLALPLLGHLFLY